MKLTFLGTGTSQGVPMIGCECAVCTSLDYRDKRLRSSVLISTDTGLQLVIDTGPDFRQQMLREKVKNIDAVLFTHEHKDHTAGLDDIRAFNYMQQRDMPVYAEPRVTEQLKQEYAYIFNNFNYPGVPRVQINTIGNAPFEIEGTQIIPIRVWHYKLPVLGFRIGNIAYITDANRIEPEELQKLQGCEYLVLNALQQTEHISHFSLQEAVSLAQTLDIPHVYFTHIGHRMGRHADVALLLPPGIEPAYDGLVLIS